MKIPHPPKTHTLNKAAVYQQLNALYDQYDLEADLDQQDVLAEWLLGHLVKLDYTQLDPFPVQSLPMFNGQWGECLVGIHHVFTQMFATEHHLIQSILEQWKTVACATPTVCIKADVIEIQFYLQPYLDIDELMIEEIRKAQERGLHIPYRYLRAIGRC